MPIIGYRPAPAFTLPTLGTGQPLTTAAMNGFQDLMAHLAGRGASAHSETSVSVNGKVRPIVGVVGGLGGGTYAWDNGKQTVFWPIEIAAGYDTITYFMSYRLQQVVNTPPDGCEIRLDLVLNGVAKRMTTVYWTDQDCATDFVNHAGYRAANFRIGNLFNLPVEQPATMYIVATFQSVHDEALFGTPSGVGMFTNDRFWNGLDYIGFAAYRDCREC